MALTAAQEKLCKTCGNVKPLSEFPRRKDAPNATHKSQCKKCRYDYTRSLPSQKKSHADWRRRNRPHLNAKARKRRADKPELVRAAYERWREKNKPYCAEASMRRASRKRNASPPWADLTAIREIYVEARRLTIETGIQHEVDHVYPLKSDVVCGLHVPANLQILTRSQNAAKKNKMPEGAWL